LADETCAASRSLRAVSLVLITASTLRSRRSERFREQDLLAANSLVTILPKLRATTLRRLWHRPSSLKPSTIRCLLCGDDPECPRPSSYGPAATTSSARAVANPLRRSVCARLLGPAIWRRSMPSVQSRSQASRWSTDESLVMLVSAHLRRRARHPSTHACDAVLEAFRSELLMPRTFRVAGSQPTRLLRRLPDPREIPPSHRPRAGRCGTRCGWCHDHVPRSPRVISMPPAPTHRQFGSTSIGPMW